LHLYPLLPEYGRHPFLYLWLLLLLHGPHPAAAAAAAAAAHVSALMRAFLSFTPVSKQLKHC
jgi:hypothetical protein